MKVYTLPIAHAVPPFERGQQRSPAVPRTDSPPQRYGGGLVLLHVCRMVYYRSTTQNVFFVAFLAVSVGRILVGCGQWYGDPRTWHFDVYGFLATNTYIRV